MNNRQKLLSELKNAFGEYISGEILSSKLNISRTAVSKHISILKKSGYNILSSPKKGYKLTDLPDLLLPDEITHELQTNVFGKNGIFYYTVIDSTNNKAKELAAEGSAEGCVIIAEEQSAGRGRKGRAWLSSTSEGICISLILRPVIPPSEVSKLTLMTAVAISETLLTLTDLDLTIKWPNDILVNGKKLAGILTEMSMEIDAIDYVVVGLGLNVNSELKSFDYEIKDIATSVCIETGRRFSRLKIVRLFLYQFETIYYDVQKHGFQEVIKRWKELSDIIGKNVSVTEAGQTLTGIVKDIAEDGMLILEGSDKETHKIISGDVVIKPG